MRLLGDEQRPNTCGELERMTPGVRHNLSGAEERALQCWWWRRRRRQCQRAKWSLAQALVDEMANPMTNAEPTKTSAPTSLSAVETLVNEWAMADCMDTVASTRSRIWARSSVMRDEQHTDRLLLKLCSALMISSAMLASAILRHATAAVS